MFGVPFKFHAIAAKREAVSVEDLHIDPDEGKPKGHGARQYQEDEAICICPCHRQWTIQRSILHAAVPPSVIPLQGVVRHDGDHYSTGKLHETAGGAGIFFSVCHEYDSM